MPVGYSNCTIALSPGGRWPRRSHAAPPRWGTGFECAGPSKVVSNGEATPITRKERTRNESARRKKQEHTNLGTHHPLLEVGDRRRRQEDARSGLLRILPTALPAHSSLLAYGSQQPLSRHSRGPGLRLHCCRRHSALIGLERGFHFVCFQVLLIAVVMHHPPQRWLVRRGPGRRPPPQDAVNGEAGGCDEATYLLSKPLVTVWSVCEAGTLGYCVKE